MSSSSQIGAYIKDVDSKYGFPDRQALLQKLNEASQGFNQKEWSIEREKLKEIVATIFANKPMNVTAISKTMEEIKNQVKKKCNHDGDTFIWGFWSSFFKSKDIYTTIDFPLATWNLIGEWCEHLKESMIEIAEEQHLLYFLKNQQPFVINSDGNTPMHLIVKYRYTTYLPSFIKQGHPIDAKNRVHNTPLHMAVFAGSIEAVQILLTNKATIDPLNKKHKTPFMAAIYLQNTAMIECFLQYGANIHINQSLQEDSSPIHLAASTGNLALVKKLIKKQVSLETTNVFQRTPLHRAVQCQHVAVVSYLLESRANVNPKDEIGWTPLHFAVTKSLTLTRLLLKYNAFLNEPNNEGNTPMHLAMDGYGSGQSLEIAQCLTQQGAQVQVNNQDHETPLHWAVKQPINNKLSTIAWLVRQGSDINARNKDGNTPMHFACNSQEGFDATAGCAIARFLVLHKQANHCIRNKEDKTPVALLETVGVRYVEETLLNYSEMNLSEIENMEQDATQHEALKAVLREKALALKLCKIIYHTFPKYKRDLTRLTSCLETVKKYKKYLE